MELSDAWVEKQLGAYRIRIGRLRPWMLREEAVPSRRLAFVERSLVARRYRLGRSVGGAVQAEWETVRGEIALQAIDRDLIGPQSWRVVGRLDYRFFGDS